MGDDVYEKDEIARRTRMIRRRRMRRIRRRMIFVWMRGRNIKKMNQEQEMKGVCRGG